MGDAGDSWLASSIWIYFAHVLSWLGAVCLFMAFKGQFEKAYERIKIQTHGSLVTREGDGPMSLATGIAVFSVAILFDFNLILAMLLGIAAFILLPIYIRRRRFFRYQEAFDASLVESLATVSSSLKAGLTLKDALVVAVQNCPAIFSSEIARVLKDYRFGMSIDKALDGVRKRVRTKNANIAFGALIIGTQLGGRIPDTLGRIVSTIREVDRVEGRLKALTAQSRAQGVLLCSMPILIFLGLYFLDYEKLQIMFETAIGRMLLGAVVFLEILGILITVRMMKLEV